MDPIQMNAEPVSTAIAQETRALQGIWQQVACEADGIANPVESYGLEPVLTILGNTFEVRRSDGIVVIKGIFTIDPTCDPQAIDWQDTFGLDAGKTFPAIYRLVGDMFTFCAADEGQVRPKSFQTSERQVMRVHKRVSAR